jgi:hypothetical protein
MRFTTAMLAALMLCVTACSDDNGNGSKCGTCPAGTTCNEATGQCESTSSGCPAGGCGANASCRDNTICVCNAGFVDCNQNLQAGGDGCECTGSCDGSSCGTGACDPTMKSSCGYISSFCDNGTCKPCPTGKLNCDGINDCEVDGACPSPGCTTKDACGKTQYCKDGTCVACPAGKYNCDGLGDCESSTVCEGMCDPTAKDSCTGEDEYCGSGNTCVSCPTGKSNCDGIGDCETTGWCLDANGCVKDCSSFDEYLCVKDPANNDRCEECLTNADCNKNPRSYGPTCDTSDIAGTGYSFCICAVDADCANKSMGNICKAVAGANPKLKQCTCDTDADCPGTHPICEGGLFKRCKARCTSDADCVKGGVQGTCNTSTGECSYPSYP